MNALIVFTGLCKPHNNTIMLLTFLLLIERRVYHDFSILVDTHLPRWHYAYSIMKQRVIQRQKVSTFFLAAGIATSTYCQILRSHRASTNW